VERDKLDIYDIAVADITSSYIESLQHMEFDPETASDFIYMAAYLLELKSRSLLPRTERIRPADEPDPRQELIMRLVEYKRFKKLAEELAAMAGGQRTYTRRPSLDTGAGGARQLAPLSLDNLFSAFMRAMAKHRVEIRELPEQAVPVTEKIAELREQLRHSPLVFADLVAGQDLKNVIVLFLAVLELVRLGEAVVHQESAFAPIRIEAVKEDDTIA